MDKSWAIHVLYRIQLAALKRVKKKRQQPGVVVNARRVYVAGASGGGLRSG